MADLDWYTYLTSISTNQSEIARAVDISPATVSRWFKRQTVPDAVQVIAVARAYQQSPTYALVAAGYLNSDEVGGAGNTHPALRLGDFSVRELARELARRLDSTRRDTTGSGTVSKLSTIRELIGSFAALRADDDTAGMSSIVEEIDTFPTHSDELSVQEVTTVCLRSLDAWSGDRGTKRFVERSAPAEWDAEHRQAMLELGAAAGEGRAVAWSVDPAIGHGARVVMGAAMAVVAGVLLAAAAEQNIPVDLAEERLWAVADEVAALR